MWFFKLCCAESITRCYMQRIIRLVPRTTTTNCTPVWWWYTSKYGTPRACLKIISIVVPYSIEHTMCSGVYDPSKLLYSDTMKMINFTDENYDLEYNHWNYRAQSQRHLHNASMYCCTAVLNIMHGRWFFDVFFDSGVTCRLYSNSVHYTDRSSA